MPSSLSPGFFSNQSPSFQDSLGARRSQVGTIEIHSKIFKNLFLQNQFAQMLVIVASPSGRLTNLFGRRPWGPKLPLGLGFENEIF